MRDLEGTVTLKNLREAFARECQASLRFLYFAQMAEAEGRGDLAGTLRQLAEAETGHALGLFDHLKRAGDPLTGLPLGNSPENLHAAAEGEERDHRLSYPAMARTAREEGFTAVADWFELLAKAEGAHAAMLRAITPGGPPHRAIEGGGACTSDREA